MKAGYDRFTQAAAAHRAGRLDEARRGYEATLKSLPNHVGALANLGSLLRAQGHLDAAIRLLDAASKRLPTATQISLNLGNAYIAAGRPSDAIRVLRQLLAHEPTHALALYSVGKCLEDVRDHAAAEVAYKQSLACDDGYYDTHLNLGGVLQTQGKFHEAIEHFKRAAELDPQRAAAWNNLGMALKELGMFAESIAAYKRAFALDPTHQIASNILFGLQYHTGLSDADLTASARTYGDRFPRLPRPVPAQPAPAVPRLGFVSADLYAHPVGFFLHAVVAKLVERGVVCFLYSNGSRQDDVTAQLARGTRWRRIVGVPDDAVAAQIRKDNIDVLIDLSGHSSQNRLPVFALRPAPVQLSWLGYFATTGMPQIDAVLMDPWHAPEGSDANFTERVVRLPHSRFCYSPPEFAPSVAPLPALADGMVTFGSFNNTAKLNDQVVALWAQVLHTVPASRLLLKWRALADIRYADEMRRRFAAHGVTSDRIELRGQSVHFELLAQYADVDIALDPFPFTGGQTSCEALWMGVPVITLPGSRPVSRQTLCFLANIGHPEWVAENPGAYVQTAASLAGDLKSLSTIRSRLRTEVAASRLCDATRFTEDFLQAIEGLCGAPRADA